MDKTIIYAKNVTSDCCNAKIRLEGIPYFIGDNTIFTVNCFCSKCEKPCGIKRKGIWEWLRKLRNKIVL